MKKLDRASLIRDLETELHYKRFIHTLSVAYTATSLAMCYGADVEKAEIAGLLHDCAKCMDLKKMIRICEKAGLSVSDIERGSGALLHSKAGSVLVTEKYGYTDPDIVNAVRYHTTGRPGMSLLEKIIFLADAIEPGRKYTGVDDIRRLVWDEGSLNKACLRSLENTIHFVKTKGDYLDPDTEKACQWLRKTESI